MTQIFKKSLMMVAMVAAIAAAQVGVTHAQIDDALIISGQTIASVDEIVVNDDQAAAYYDPATGDVCLLYTSPSPRDQRGSRMPSSA